MKKAKLPPEADAGRKVILGFMDLGVNDMSYTLDALRRIYENARKLHDEMMDRELRRLGAKEEKAAGIKKARAKPQPKFRSRKDRNLVWSGRGSIPKWMRDEMKAGKLKQEAFLIKVR